MGSAITPITFSYILTVKEIYNPLAYFRMGIIEEVMEDPTRNQKLCAEMMQE